MHLSPAVFGPAKIARADSAALDATAGASWQVLH